MIQKEIKNSKFGDITLVTIVNAKGASVTLSALGAGIVAINVPDKTGRLDDVVLGYADPADFMADGPCAGKVPGRFANRIARGHFKIDGKAYSLAINNGPNALHGGPTGFQNRIWTLDKAEDDTVRFSYRAADGEEGYPGNLLATATYRWTDDCTLSLTLTAETDAPTVVNLTNHAYFNLNGEGDGNILDHELWLESDELAMPGPNITPEGGFYAVKGTPFDFNQPKLIGRDIGNDDDVLKKGNGYDHCMMLKNKCGEYVRYAVAKSAKTGIRMTCYTDQPAVQFYSGNGLHAQGRGCYYGAHAGFCLETQEIPNNINVPEYAQRGSSLLDAGEVYSFRSVYRFDTDK